MTPRRCAWGPVHTNAPTAHVQKALFKFMSCQFTIKLNRSEVPIKTTIRSLLIFSIFVFWKQGDWDWHHPRFQKFAFSVNSRSRCCCGLKSFRFHRFLVDGEWTRSKVFAFSNENAFESTVPNCALSLRIKKHIFAWHCTFGSAMNVSFVRVKSSQKEKQTIDIKQDSVSYVWEEKENFSDQSIFATAQYILTIDRIRVLEAIKYRNWQSLRFPRVVCWYMFTVTQDIQFGLHNMKPPSTTITYFIHPTISNTQLQRLHSHAVATSGEY